MGRGFAAAGLLLALAIGWWLAVATDRRAPMPHFADARPPVSTTRCAACHPHQAQTLRDAPHTVTLQPASSSEMLALWDGLKYRDPSQAQITDQFEVRDQRLWRRSTALPDPVAVDWIFGSGRHARTPVTVHEAITGGTELFEHRLSWYPDMGLDLTLGLASESRPNIGWHGLGKRLNPDDAADCFGCHSSWLPSNDGHLDLSRIEAGVQCSRCHQENESHIRAATAGEKNLHVDPWSDLSPLESIRRCGECHRRDDQQTPYELRSTNPVLIRFAPVGLSQSKCFAHQEKMTASEGQRLRLDCMTCHNPHRAAATDEQYYVSRCLNCHTGQRNRAANCSSSASSEHCLSCHMPKIEVQPHLRFTDHWIRKRSESKED